MAADVKTHLYEWSTTEGSNLPVGSTVVSTNLDDNLRMIQKVVRDLAAPTTLAAAAGTTDLGSKDETFITTTGTAVTITGLGTVAAGIYKWVIFNAAHVLTHNATSLILPSAANITAAAGDVGCFVSLASGNWRCVSYTRASGNNILNATAFSDGTLSAPGIAFASDLNTGLYRTTTDSFAAVAGGVAIATFANITTITPTNRFDVTAGAAINLVSAVGADINLIPDGAGATGGAINLIGGTGSITGGGVKMQGGVGTVGGGGNIDFWRNTTNSPAIRINNLGHLVGVAGQSAEYTPTITSGGGTSPTIVGSDMGFKITLGASPSTTAIVVDFYQNFTAAPMVIAQYQTAHIALRAVAAVNTVTITPAAEMTENHVIDVILFGREA